jgi:hypothetical protein
VNRTGDLQVPSSVGNSLVDSPVLLHTLTITITTILTAT